MNHSMLCSPFAPLIEAYHDDELAVEEQIAVANHLTVCASCNAKVHELRSLRHALQRPALDRACEVPDAVLDRVKHAVVSQTRIERGERIGVRLGHLFDDLHLVWAGLAGSAATALCVVIMGAVLQFAPPERSDSLAVLLSEPGTNRNPLLVDVRMALPRVEEQNVTRAMLVSDEGADTEQSMIVSGVVTLEGRLSRPALLSANYHGTDARRLMDAVSAARFQPAQRFGSPVAVNLVWLLERTTVRGKISG